jgi:hypothetical protein
MDEQESTPDLPSGELRDITLRIPGECFFCESISLPDVPPAESETKPFSSISHWDGYLLDLLNSAEFSPYPAEQLAWGYHLCESSNRALVFATPVGRLRQLGWQNLELFRRVFPSFISLLGKVYEEATAIFLLCEESLSLACFSPGSQVPDFVYSRGVDLAVEDGLDKSKALLLGLIDLSKYEVCPDILVTKEVYRMENNSFQFEQQWLLGKDPTLELDQDVVMDADELWQHDLRNLSFKAVEKTRRKQERTRWKFLKVGTAVALFLISGFVGLKIVDLQLQSYALKEQSMSRQVPLVLESQKLLEKLKQNQLGGIDPFGTIGRVANYRGGSFDNPHVWFSEAHFETRNHVKLEGEGRNVESVNNFIERLETNNVAIVRKDRSGDELRDIKSGGGGTSFKVEFEMLEEQVTPSSQENTSRNIEASDAE